MLPRMGEESVAGCNVYNDERLRQYSVRSGLITVVLKCEKRLVRQSASTACGYSLPNTYSRERGIGYETTAQNQRGPR